MLPRNLLPTIPQHAMYAYLVIKVVPFAVKLIGLRGAEGSMCCSQIRVWPPKGELLNAKHAFCLSLSLEGQMPCCIIYSFICPAICVLDKLINKKRHLLFALWEKQNTFMVPRVMEPQVITRSVQFYMGIIQMQVTRNWASESISISTKIRHQVI